jgi:cell division protein FtsB
VSHLSWYRDRVARLERQVGEWMATAAQLQRENTELRAEIARLQGVERAAFRADL